MELILGKLRREFKKLVIAVEDDPSQWAFHLKDALEDDYNYLHQSLPKANNLSVDRYAQILIGHLDKYIDLEKEENPVFQLLRYIQHDLAKTEGQKKSAAQIIDDLKLKLEEIRVKLQPVEPKIPEPDPEPTPPPASDEKSDDVSSTETELFKDDPTPYQEPELPREAFQPITLQMKTAALHKAKQYVEAMRPLSNGNTNEWMGATLVPNQLYQAFLSVHQEWQSKEHQKVARMDAQLPAVNLGYRTIQAFMQWMNESFDQWEFKLPTTLQWRTAVDTEADLVKSIANSIQKGQVNYYELNGGEGVTNVEWFACNGNGFHDLLGNAYDLCRDSNDNLSLVGGYYASVKSDLKKNINIQDEQDVFASNIGFRLVRYDIKKSGQIEYPTNSINVSSDDIPAKDKILDLIRKNELAQAIHELKRYQPILDDKTLIKKMILLERQFHETTDRYRMYLLERENYTVEINRICTSILDEIM